MVVTNVSRYLDLTQGLSIPGVSDSGEGCPGQGRIKALVGPRHFENFCEAKNFILPFVGTI
jgi:hypothetical protein